MFAPTYHLRRVNPKAPSHPEELILLGEVTKFGRNADNVDVVLTSAVYSNMISRDHAVIVGTIDQNTRQIVGYKIRDNSLNGTYINDKRVKDEMILEDSSVIKFGHMNGAAIKAGAAAPQANAEFSFVFEKCIANNRRYLGWEGFERRKTVVCTGDGKYMHETGEDHRTKRKSPTKEPVSSTTAPILHPFSIQHTPQVHPATTVFPPTPGLQQDIYQMLQAQGKFPVPFGLATHQTFNPSLFQQHQLGGFQMGMRPNGQYSAGCHPPSIVDSIVHQPTVPVPITQQSTPRNTHMDGKPSSSSAPIRSPPVECDSSVPSPPKNGRETRTGHADSSSQHSPRRAKDDDEDSFSVPDSPPRAPRPVDIAGRSVTNSPAPPSPKPVEKMETPKEEKKKIISPKKPVNPGKVPKTGGGVEKKKKNNEADRLLTDLTEGSFMMQARRKSIGGVGSERRKMINEGKKSVKVVSKNKLHRQLSSASSDEESDDDEVSGVPLRSPTCSRPMVGKKASSAITTQKGRKSGTVGRGKKQESDDSDPYEETDEESNGGEMKNGKKKTSKKSPLGNAKNAKEKATPKAMPKRKIGKKKRKSSDDSSESEEEKVERVVKKMQEEEDEEFVDTEDTKCGLPACKLPKGTDVSWVECDGCSVWYHCFCLFGKNMPYKGNHFYCGCTDSPAKKMKKK